MIPYQYQYQYQYDIRYQQHQDLGLWSIDTISVRNHNPILIYITESVNYHVNTHTHTHQSISNYIVVYDMSFFSPDCIPSTSAGGLCILLSVVAHFYIHIIYILYYTGIRTVIIHDIIIIYIICGPMYTACRPPERWSPRLGRWDHL